MARSFLTSRLWPVLLLAGGLSACASVSTRLPDISLPQLQSEQASQESAAFAKKGALQLELNRVAFPMLAANTALCPKTKHDIGATTHTLKSYSKALRPAAAREIGARDTPSIIFVRPDTALAKAGVQPGDEILGPALLGDADTPLSATDKRFQAYLMGGGRDIRIRRGDDIRSVSVEPVEICGYPVRLSMSSTVNAYANGRAVNITSGMMDFTQSDAELALIIGHELAHNTMGHIRKIVTNSILTGIGSKYTRPFELEADYVGLYYTARAGFDISSVESVWRRMALLNPRSVAKAKTHPTYPDRYLRMQAAMDEIVQKRATGQALVPNFLTDDGADAAPDLEQPAP